MTVHQVDRPSFALTDRVLAHQRTGSCAAALLREISIYVYQYPRRKYPSLDEDAGGEFFLFVESKLPRLLARFRDCGKPFEHYLNSVLSWQLKSFLLRRQHSEMAWRLGVSSPRWCDAASGYSDGVDWVEQDDCAERGLRGEHARSPQHAGSGEGATGAPIVALPHPPAAGLPTDADAWRLLFALLKASDRLPPAATAAALEQIQCSKLWFDQVVQRLSDMRASAQARLEKLRKRRNRAFASLAMAEEALRTEHTPSRYEQLRARISRLRTTLKTAQEEMAKVRLAPTNREIAAALGIPKGTVDTGLFWLKRQSSRRYAALGAPDPGQRQSA